jgi:hypothetical protein
VFFAAPLTLNLTITSHPVVSAMVLITIAVTFINGYFWARVPDTHLSEFRAAMSHGEILLMIDVAEQDLANVETNFHRHHPGAIECGTSWSVAAIDL